LPSGSANPNSEFFARPISVGDDELQALERARRHRLPARQVADDDRATRAGRSQLREPHARRVRVMVEVEAELIAVERDGPVNVADRDHHDLERPVDQSFFNSSSSFS
jgi:hypothetical protein